MNAKTRAVGAALVFVAALLCSGVAFANYINGTTLPPATGPTPDETCLPMGSAIGLRWSYCDVASALFSYSQVDMTLAGPMPIVLRRIFGAKRSMRTEARWPTPSGRVRTSITICSCGRRARMRGRDCSM